MKSPVAGWVIPAIIALLVVPLAAPTAQAAVPAAAVLVTPDDGATAGGTDVPLAVRASDPDGGSVQVRFEGRRRGAVTQPPASKPFTLVAIPDVQNYTYSNRQAAIAAQAQWVIDTREQLNTQMVVQLGDLVSNHTNLTQWGHASEGLRVLDNAGVPNSVVAGNHDFDNATGAHPQYDQFFPPSRYAGKKWTPSTARYGGYLGQNLFGPDPVDTANMNNFVLFSAAGRDFLVLNLEWEAPGYATAWATKVLQAYPDRIAILVTHSFVGINGQRRVGSQRPGGTAPAQLWTDFVSQQCQIRLVLNGHFSDGDLGEAQRTDPNRCGNPVPQILTNYQSRANGGDGWLRYYTFDAEAGTMDARTYSPTLGLSETDADSQFTLPFDLAGPESAAFETIGTVTVPSGEVAKQTWTGLTADATYEWRAVTSDGEDQTVSDTWVVRTPPSHGDLVVDDFSRTVTDGWGAPPGRSAWQLTGRTQSFSVNGIVGRVEAPAGSTRAARQPTASAADVAVQTDLALDSATSGGGTYVTVQGRVNGTSSYRAKVRYLATGGVNLSLTRTGTAETMLDSKTVAGLAAVPGQYLRLRFEVEGTVPSLLRAKIWQRGRAEPAAWTVTASDSASALQQAGAVGLDLYQSSSASSAGALLVDRFEASRLDETPPPQESAVFAADDFERSVSNGWGSAELGGTWTSTGTDGRYAVTAGAGSHVLSTPGRTAESVLSSVSAEDVDLRADLAWSRTATQGTIYTSVILRRQSAGSDYRVKVIGTATGKLQLALIRRVDGAEVSLRSVTVPGVSLAADVPYRIGFRVVGTEGTTTLSAKLWRVGTAEPGAWAVTDTDSTVVLQRAGRIGINSYLSGSAAAGVTTRVDNLVAQEPR